MKWMLLALSFASLNACATAPDANSSPILAFHKVEDALYRGAQPDEAGMRYLKSLGVKSIVKLNQEMPEEMVIASSYGIKILYTPLSGFFSPNEDDVKTIESFIQNPLNQPVYVHCEHGHDRTGLIVGLHRTHEGWTKEKAYDEMRALGFHPSLLGLEIYFWRDDE